MINRKAINYYASFYDVSKELNHKQFYEFNTAIFSVMFYERHIDDIVFDDKLLSIAWLSIKHSLKASIDGYCSKKSIKYDTTLSKGVTKGVTKGVSKGLSNNNNKNNNKNSNSNNSSKPTLEQVEKYCLERKNNIDPNSFIDYYESSGWIKANGQKVKDWKATVRTWEKRDKIDNTDNQYMGAR